jgi:hypothetical protein
VPVTASLSPESAHEEKALVGAFSSNLLARSLVVVPINALLDRNARTTTFAHAEADIVIANLALDDDALAVPVPPAV